MSTPALEVRGLSRSYGRRAAVADLDLTVLPGDVYGFLGPNGAGKTTAIRCILGLIRPDAGQVSIFGERSPVAARRHVGAIVETPAFHLWMSGRDNLEIAAVYAGLPSGAVRAEVDRVLERVGLLERSKDAVRGYSLGMKQRLGLARAMLGRPRLLVLDEPTNGLDPRGMREVRDLLRSLALHDGLTVFLSSHLLSEIQALCNRVGIVQEGRLRAEGQVNELVGAEGARPIVEVGTPERAALEAALRRWGGGVLLGPGAQGRHRVRLDRGTVPELVQALVADQIPLEAVVPEARNLEDVFLEVTR
jgi:ABC-2 type transport system ATP-binding protein